MRPTIAVLITLASCASGQQGSTYSSYDRQSTIIIGAQVNGNDGLVNIPQSLSQFYTNLPQLRLPANASGYSPAQVTSNDAVPPNTRPGLFVDAQSVRPPAPNDDISATRFTSSVQYAQEGYDRLAAGNLSVSVSWLQLANRAIYENQGSTGQIDCNKLLTPACARDITNNALLNTFDMPKSCADIVISSGLGGIGLYSSLKNDTTKMVGSQNFTRATYLDQVFQPVARGNSSIFEFTQTVVRAALVVEGNLGPYNASLTPSSASRGNFLLCSRAANLSAGSGPKPAYSLIDSIYSSASTTVSGPVGWVIGAATFAGLLLSM